MKNTHKGNKYFQWTIGFGLILLAVYYSEDLLFRDLWTYSLIVWAVAGLSFLASIVLGLEQRDFRVLLISIGVALIITLSEVLQSETFKSEKVLTAVFYDEQATLTLTLRKNHSFELFSTTPFTHEKFTGQYKLSANKIVFLSRPYHNGFIPDTVSIVHDKIILRLDEKGQPNTAFENFLAIQYNSLNKPR